MSGCRAIADLHYCVLLHIRGRDSICICPKRSGIRLLAVPMPRPVLWPRPSSLYLTSSILRSNPSGIRPRRQTSIRLRP
ncbi:hypothetical protein BV20DRAFT_200771 [Pilatotrama ljubarskyi]|nr:hypothetical protein BV20DRAFT_200771 [Pilatotrama ljubarskyi]